MNIRYRVELSETERTEIQTMLSGGRHAARKLKRAQILLASDAGQSDEAIAASVAVSASTVGRTKRRFVEGNLERALSEGARPGATRKLSGQEEALLVATACSSPPEGRACWTLELLAGEMVRLTHHDSLSRDTVRRRLAENELKPWREKMWCVPQVDGEFVARMEDVLDLYAEPPDPKCPVVCLDESPLQLIGETRQPIPAAPGQVARVDYEYRRCGTVNLFVVLDVHRPWRKVTITERRTAQDYAARLRALVDVDYPQAERIRVVQDNLSTHTPGSLYEAFPAAEARRILRRLEFHYTPKHVHAQARQLAQHGGNRDRGAEGPVLGPAHRHARETQAGDRRLGARSQHERGADPLDVHHSEGPHQDGPHLPEARRGRRSCRRGQSPRQTIITTAPRK
jgi:transposase